MAQEKGYNYWGRGIEIDRSNTEVVGLTHYVVGETALGHPYRGFLAASKCANISFRDCFPTGHKIYQTIGAAGEPVSMGSYDMHANNVANLHMADCRMNHILDRTRWGVIATNFCKNIVLENCVLSRMDTHMGIAGDYTIRGCTLGHMGLNAIGRGVLSIADSTLYGSGMVKLRGDYGSTWEGELIIRDSRWIPNCGDGCVPHLIQAGNDGMHDFGYPCFQPREITLDGVFVDDSAHPEDYAGMYLFSDPDCGVEDLPADRPFPYQLCEEIVIRDLQTATGKPPTLCPNPAVAESTTVIDG